VRRQGRRRWERQGVAVSFVCAIARPRLGLEGSVHREGDGREDDVGAGRRSARRRGVWARSDVEAGGGSGDEESGARSDVEREADPATRRLCKVGRGGGRWIRRRGGWARIARGLFLLLEAALGFGGSLLVRGR
jgi:hypothetical protein